MSSISLYIHIPFCRSKCNYCDFNSYDNITHLMEDYVGALHTEMEAWRKELDGRHISSVYIGGGTPTFLKNNLLQVVLDGLNTFDITSKTEITVEANPNTIDEEKLVTLKKNGVNRLSMGLQTCDEELLRVLGRTHTFDDFKKSFVLARNLGFGNINVDLIFGMPGQTLKSWENTLKKLIEYRPEHISVYSLTVEKNTPLDLMIKKRKIKPVDDGTDRQMYRLGINMLVNAGYEHYEISNFASRGKECIHNVNYWKNREYIGFGAGAHSYYKNKRFSNTADPQRYIQRITAGKSPVSYTETITKPLEMAETMFLGLRLIRGIQKTEFSKRFNINIKTFYRKQIETLKEKGLLEENETHFKLSSKGLDVANEVFVSFIP